MIEMSEDYSSKDAPGILLAYFDV
uniref:Uncharacterized protein n=1 Tax=Anguilla anguilla TaxID=7936 RepID=A0A0E9QT77_ANGAN